GLVHQVFHYKFDPNYCRHRWVFLRPKLGGTADKLQVEFQKLFLEAYESGEIPGIDFVEPEKYDWLGIVEWAERRLSQTNPLNGLPELPKNRQTLDKRFDVRHATDVYNIPREDFWVANVTHLRREELANSWTFARPLAGATEPVQDDDDLMLALSWVRANVITPDPVYDSNKAHEKLIKIEQLLPQALDHLLGAKIIRMENKGRQIPGRNYDISDSVLTMFKRQWDVRYLKKTAAFKKTIDEAFADDGKLTISYQATDAEMTAMTNLVAAGRAKVVPLLPEVNHAMGAPYPRLTKWGFTEGNYKTVHMDKSRLHFLLELHPTSTYVRGIPIAPIPSPPLSKQFPGELGPRLPIWTDIHGNIIKDYWQMTVMATLWLLAFRPGLKIQEICKGAYKGKLWDWEMEMFLAWAESAGLAKRLVYGGDDGPEADGSLRIAPQHTVPYHITAAVVPAMDADTAASRGQETTHESDSVLEDIGLLFKDSVDKPTIRCWNEAEICEIIHDNHETVQLVSRGDASWPAYTATFNRHLLTRVSPYFRALLEGGFSESTKKILPVDSDAYELRIFEKWLSTGSIEVEYHWYIDMVYLYKFADYYDIPALRREVMSELVKQARKQRGFWLASVAVEHLPSSSPLYRFFVEEFVQHANDIFHGGYELVTKEFLSLIFTGLAKRSADNPCRCCHNPCDFHDHDSEEEWEKTCHVTHPEFPKPDPSTYRKLPMGRQR
ncbi:hypothetical protein KCU79_g2293, partial [Aureobasidium melanogenum]